MRLASGGQWVEILRNINLEVPEGTLLSVVGPSGSGKSTLLGLIAGLDTPTSGAIRLNGSLLADLDEDERTRFRGKMLGFIFQSYHLIPSLTALENVSVPLELAGEADALKRSRVLLDSVGLGHRGHHYPLQLSGGEQQRVAIARAIARRPPILLADEPTGNLDSATGQMVMDLLLQIHRTEGNTTLLVTHNASLAAQADRVVTLGDGTIAEDMPSSGRT